MNILITGTSLGIGKAIAEKFLREGHKVYGIDILPSSLNDKHYHHFRGDIRSIELPKIEPLHILINNAGVQDNDPIDVNLRGTIRVTEEYVNQSSIKSILFVASSSASTGAEFPEYAASKGGMLAYMKNVASRVAPFGATCNSISPGGVKTALNQHILDDPKLYEEVLNETMLHAWAEPEEIAEWAYFLTVINRSMTAQDVLVDNGEAAKFHFVW